MKDFRIALIGADGLWSCYLQHLLNERARYRRFLALLRGLPAQESPRHDDRTGG